MINDLLRWPLTLISGWYRTCLHSWIAIICHVYMFVMGKVYAEYNHTEMMGVRMSMGLPLPDAKTLIP